jgi:hypothetical protein
MMNYLLSVMQITTVPDVDEETSQPHTYGEEESDMNILHDSIADGLMAM